MKTETLKVPEISHDLENQTTSCDSCHVSMPNYLLRQMDVISKISKKKSLSLCQICYQIEIEVRYGPFYS